MSIPVRNILALIRAEAFDAFVLTSATAAAKWLEAEKLVVVVVHTTPPPSFALGEEPHLELPSEESFRVHRIDVAGESSLVVGQEVERHQINLVVAAEAAMETQRLLRSVSCALLILPHCEVEPRGPILVPLDRDNIRLATLQFASNLSQITNEPLEILNLYSVPVGYHKMGQSHREFAEIMRAHSAERIAAALARLEHHGPPIIDTRLVLIKSTKSIAVAIVEEARARRYSQIVVGGRLRRPVAGILLPSISERVVLSSPWPTWVVRDGSDPIGFIEAASS
jgi:nucleotide-binding universal stress UspA family protein